MSANKTSSGPGTGLGDLGSSWAPAGWAPSESFYDDTPFGSVLGDPLMGSPVFDVSVLDAVPGWQDEDAGTAPELRPAEAAPSVEERAHAASSERIKEGARRRAASHRQASRTTSRTTAPASAQRSASRTSAPRTAAPSTASRRVAAPVPRPAPVATPGAGHRQVPSHPQPPAVPYPRPLPPGAPGGIVPVVPSPLGPGAANPSWGSPGPRGAGGYVGAAPVGPYTGSPQQQPPPVQAVAPFPQARLLQTRPQAGEQDEVLQVLRQLKPYAPWIILVLFVMLINSLR